MNQITKEHILQAIQEIDKEGIRNGRHSSTYDLIYEGKSYPPKLVISIANRFATGEELDSNTFYGGLGTDAFKLIEKYGFRIVPKKDKITELISAYKNQIKVSQLKDEKYKWELLEQFKGRPNLNSKDFINEIKGIKYNNLIYPMALAVLHNILNIDEEVIRSLFKDLFNESVGLSSRVEKFSDSTLKVYRDNGGQRQHHQDERSIATYLTFYNPEKYTFYKSSFYKKLCQLLNVKIAPKNEKYVHYLELVNKIVEDYIKDDDDLINSVKKYVPEYDGSNHLLLTQDILYQMLDKVGDLNYWLYSPGENASKWEEFYQEGIIGLGWDEIGNLEQYKSRAEIKNALINAYGGEGDKKNDVSANDDFINKMNVGDLIIVKKGRGELLGYGIITSEYYFDDKRNNYKHCRKVDWKLKGCWNANHSLALKTLTDITNSTTFDENYSKYHEHLLAIMNGSIKSKNYKDDYSYYLDAIYNANSGTKTSYIKAIEILSKTLNYSIFEEDNLIKLQELYSDLIKEQKNKEGKYFHPEAPSYGQNGFYSASIKTYIDFHKQLNESTMNDNKNTTSLNQILYGPPGTGKTYRLQKEFFDKFTVKETSLSREQYLESKVADLTWWQVICIAVLDIGTAKVNDIYNHEFIQLKEKLSSSKTVRPTIWGQLQSHTVMDCEYVNVINRSEPLFFNKNEKSEWTIDSELVTQYYPEAIDLLEESKNYKPKNDSQIKNFEFITFHQSFSYEDFIEGIKPKLEDGESDLSFEIKDGVFKKLCLKAEADPANDYAIFIDEINRGNVSAIFGELITLIEEDKRLGKENQLSIKLPYSKTEFGVPSNLYIIGTMNTADRSVEALDTALRRRFSFTEMMPDVEVVKEKNFTDFERATIMDKINQRIELLLDKNYTLGHSYFMKKDFKNSFENEIIPLLQEYFYNDYGKIGLILGKGFVQEKEISKKTDNSIFADFETKNEIDIIKSYELRPFVDVNFKEAIQTLLA